MKNVSTSFGRISYDGVVSVYPPLARIQLLNALVCQVWISWCNFVVANFWAGNFVITFFDNFPHVNPNDEKKENILQFPHWLHLLWWHIWHEAPRSAFWTKKKKSFGETNSKAIFNENGFSRHACFFSIPVLLQSLMKITLLR